MKVEYINPFYQATVDVLGIMLEIEPTRGTIRAVHELSSIYEANVSIGVTGDLRGSLLYSFPENMALKMVRIMSGLEMTKLDAFVTSALSEIANIISGNALTYLTKNSLTCDISPPQVFIGSSGALTMSTAQAIVLPLITDIGTFEVSISLHGK